MKKMLLTSLLVIVLIVLGGCTKNENKLENKKSLEKIQVQAGWLLNGEFANICSAIIEGYYQEEGLEVELVPGGPTGASFIVATNAIAQDENLELAVDGDLVPLLKGVTKENENEKLKVKAFASFWNENPYGFIVRTDSDLTSLKDFFKTKPDGTKYKIGITADSVSQYAIAKYAGLPVEDLDLVIVGFDATPFLTGQVDALASYWTTQAYEVEKAGIDYQFLSMSEVPGLSQPSMIAMATDNMLKNNKDQLTRWLRATIKGSQFIIDNPDKAAEQILNEKCGGPAFDKTQEAWLIKKSIPLFDEERIGWINQEQVMNYAKAFYELGQIPSTPTENQILDYSILNEIYQ